MRVAVVAICLLAACATAGGAPRETGTSPRAERAQVLDEVIATRYDRLSRDPAVDLCSVYLALDRDPGFRDRLRPFVRQHLSTQPVESCPRTLTEQRQDAGWFVLSIARTGRDELTINAVANGHGGHRETYLLEHGYGDRQRWRVREIRIHDFWYE